MKFKALFIVLMLSAAPALAEENDVLKLNAFGTLGLVHSDNDKADFVTTVVQSRGAGYTRDWSAVVDSRLGVQLTYLPTDKLSAVLQVIAEQRDDGVIRPEVEWAYLQYAITPALSVRVGRTVLPTYLHSQYRKVSYANHWVRPPAEFYVVPVNSSDGISILFNSHIGELNYALHAVFGQGDQDQGRMPDNAERQHKRDFRRVVQRKHEKQHKQQDADDPDEQFHAVSGTDGDAETRAARDGRVVPLCSGFGLGPATRHGPGGTSAP